MNKRQRILINGVAHYDKGSDWYRKNAITLIDRRPASVVTLQEEIGEETGSWETVAEARGESAYSN